MGFFKFSFVIIVLFVIRRFHIKIVVLKIFYFPHAPFEFRTKVVPHHDIVSCNLYSNVIHRFTL